MIVRPMYSQPNTTRKYRFHFRNPCKDPIVKIQGDNQANHDTLVAAKLAQAGYFQFLDAIQKSLG